MEISTSLMGGYYGYGIDVPAVLLNLNQIGGFGFWAYFETYSHFYFAMNQKLLWLPAIYQLYFLIVGVVIFGTGIYRKLLRRKERRVQNGGLL